MVYQTERTKTLSCLYFWELTDKEILKLDYPESLSMQDNDLKPGECVLVMEATEPFHNKDIIRRQENPWVMDNKNTSNHLIKQVNDNEWFHFKDWKQGKFKDIEKQSSGLLQTCKWFNFSAPPDGATGHEIQILKW